MAKHRVLVVDDAPFIREIVGHILERSDYDIVGEAENGVDAVKKATELQPDLVLLDIVMPLKSGIQAAVEILELLPETKIVMMSTVDQNLMSVKAMETGAHDLIHKPFRSNDVLSVLDKVMSEGP